MTRNWIGIGLLLMASVSTGADPKAHVTFIVHEDEYKADESVPPFAKFLTEKYGYGTTVLLGNDRGIEGLDALKTTDVLVLFVRRKVLPKEQLDAIRAYIDSGRGLVSLRTSCHAFATAPWVKKKKPEPVVGVEWKTFDLDVLGCQYTGHYGNKTGTDVTVPPDAVGHPILANVTPRDWHSTGSLYKVLPLAAYTKVLMNGKTEDHVEPVAWVRNYKKGKVFTTTLGHIDDFALPQFRQLLVQAIAWTAAK